MGGKEAIQLRDMLSGEVATELGRTDSIVTALTAASDGQRVASADQDGTIHVWALDSGESVASFHRAGVRVQQLLFLPEDERLISVDEEFTVRLWTPDTNDPVGEWKPPRADAWMVTSMALSSDGRFAATGEHRERSTCGT